MPAYLLFFLMLFVPTTYQPIKGALIVVVLAIIATEMFYTKRIAIHRTVLAITIFMSAVGLLFVNLGLLNRNPGAIKVMPVYVLWPLLYLLFVAGCARVEVIRGLMKVLVIGCIGVSLYALLYILHESKLVPGFLYYALDQGQNIAFYEGHIAFVLYSISSLLYLVPFLLAALVLWPEELRPPVSRRWIWIAFILSIVPVILSERKVLWFLILASPVMALGLRLLLPAKSRIATQKIAKRTVIGMLASGVALLLILRFALNFDFSILVNLVTDAINVNSGTSEDVIVRQAQYTSMMSEWANSPLIGTGLGGVASYIRNAEQPWTYELSYVALLYHTGFIGMLIYSAGILWTYVQCYFVLRTDEKLGLYMGPVLIGTTCFLIGNASNPYFEKYDYLWVLFLPVAIINIHLLNKAKRRKEAVVNVAA